MTQTVADFDGGSLLTERESREMLSNHKLLESAAGPEELAEGPEGLHLGTLLSVAASVPLAFLGSYRLKNSGDGG